MDMCVFFQFYIVCVYYILYIYIYTHNLSIIYLFAYIYIYIIVGNDPLKITYEYTKEV